jgi:hypothetical protein
MGSIFALNFLRSESFRDVCAGGCVLGYSVDLFLPDPRGSHLSCLEDFAVLENGVPISPEKLRFSLNGKTFLVSHFPLLAYEYWRIDEDATLSVMDGRSCAEVQELQVSFGMRVPYAGNTSHPVVATFAASARPQKGGGC